MLQLLFYFISITSVIPDTPADCRINQIYGKWTFKISQNVKIDCSKEENYTNTLIFNLKYPNIVEQDNGEPGTFTMVYNQGFEINIGLHSYFTFFWWKGDLPYPSASEFSCAKTMPGWVTDVAGNDRRCIVGEKMSTVTSNKLHFNIDEHDNQDFENFDTNLQQRIDFNHVETNSNYKIDNDLVEKINKLADNTWKASTYPHLWNDTMTIQQTENYFGSRRLKIAKNFKQHQSTSKPNSNTNIPNSWDWRNINGQNYVSPVRHQDQCGSCYIFSSAAALESRIRISTNNKKQPILSPQQAVDCSFLSQGCSGGYPYLIFGRWAKNFGFVDEACYPYKGKNGVCRDPKINEKAEFKDCFNNRYHTISYNYVGGYFGNCNAELMKEEIYKNGPITVGFEVEDDFRYYKSGIYRHTKLKSQVNKNDNLEPFNHGVTIVGYSHSDEENLDYWIVKNSWGEKWGEDGYFRIVRGVDEVAIETLGVAAHVIPPL